MNEAPPKGAKREACRRPASECKYSAPQKSSVPTMNRMPANVVARAPSVRPSTRATIHSAIACSIW